MEGRSDGRSVEKTAGSVERVKRESVVGRWIGGMDGLSITQGVVHRYSIKQGFALLSHLLVQMY